MATQYDVDYYRDEISITVATQYLQTLFYIEFVEIATNQLDITNQQVSRTKKLVEAGTLAKGDLLTIEAQQASEEYAIIDAENNLRLSYLTLSQLLELESPQGFEIEKPALGLMDQPEIYTPDQIYSTALASRPEIKSAEYRVESSKSGLSIAKGGYYPRLSLSGSLGSGYSGANQVGSNPFTDITQIGQTTSGEAVYTEYTDYESYSVKTFGDQLQDNFNRTAGLNLNIPIFNGWVARSNVAQAKIGIENANLDLKLQKNNLNKVIQQAYNDALAASNQHKAAQKKVDATGESFKYAEQKFDVGLINSVEYNDAKKEYNNALSQLVQAKYDLVFKNTIIDFYMGKPLTLDR
jgi:outer membrane protein